MKPSKFNVVVPNFPGPGEHLIFNTFSDSRAVVNQRLKTAMEYTRDLPSLNAEEQRFFSELENLGFMVGNEVDEDRELEYRFQRLKFDTTTLDVTVLTTSACNLGCGYCYQDGIDLKRFMRDEACARVCEWTAAKLDEIRPKSLHLTLFGGEPLLNPQACRILARSFFQMATERRVEPQISIITNGVLLTEPLVDELIPLGLKRVKVTLDGDREAHDSKRHYHNGKGTFDVILKNLLALKGKAPISIGGNFDERTRDSIPRLLDRLLEYGFKPEDFSDVTFKPILAATGPLPVLNNAMDSGHSCTFSDMKVSDILWLYDEVTKRGFRTTEHIAIGPCCATREHSFTIDPHGKIYKCPALVGREEYITGDVGEHPENYKNTQFMTVDLWRDSFCQPCAFRPLCGGGCRGSSVAQSGDFQTIACEKPYFENVAMEIVKREAVQNQEGGR